MVHLQGEWPPESVELLSSMVPGVRITSGEEHPPGGLDVLVSGRPTEAQLIAAGPPRMLLVPYAGLPAGTRELMLAYPSTAVHNLHHNAPSAAELALGLMLAAGRRIIPADRALRMGDWTPRYGMSDHLLVFGSTVLVLGWGAVGRRVGAACAALGGRVMAVRRRPDGDPSPALSLHGPEELRHLLPEADVLVLALPLTSGTEGLIGDRELELMKKTSVLVNVGRGPLVDQDALHRHLSRGSIGAAGLDVWYSYPGREGERSSTMPSRAPLWELDNVVMTPHVGGLFGSESLERMRLEALAEVIRCVRDRRPAPWRVDPALGY